jgi:Phage protein (N4 Gp49/phage Sf6 gene 66) family
MNEQQVEQEIQAKGLNAPRITPTDLDAEIAAEYTFTAAKATQDCPQVPELGLLTICVLVLKNGFTVVGKSACASAANFNAELGAKIARNDAREQLWPLLGFRLRDSLAEQAATAA